MPIPAGVVPDQPGLLERAIGDAPIVVTIGGVEVPRAALGPVTIIRGRTRPDQRPAAAACSVILSTADLPALPVLGDAVTVDLTDASAAYFTAPDDTRPRFRGKVTDLQARPVAEVTGGARLTLLAAGPRAELADLDIAGGAYPAETEGERAGRMLDAITATLTDLTVAYVDPGWAPIAARAGSVASAGSLLDELSVSTGGELVELRDGSVAWQDIDHRADSVPAVTFYAGQVLADALWQQDRAGLLNDVTIEYAGGNVRVVDDAAVAAIGFRARQTLTTTLADSASATTRGNDIVSRYGWPRWRLDQLPVDLLRTVDPATGGIVLGLDVSDLIEVTGFPSTGPFVESQLYVEGAAETITRHGWRVALNVSESGLTAAAPRWIDVPESVLWTDVPPDLTWIGAAGWTLPPGTGDRWSDQPGDLRWAAVTPDTTTWDTY